MGLVRTAPLSCAWIDAELEPVRNDRLASFWSPAYTKVTPRKRRRGSSGHPGAMVPVTRVASPEWSMDATWEVLFFPATLFTGILALAGGYWPNQPNRCRRLRRAHRLGRFERWSDLSRGPLRPRHLGVVTR